MLTILVKQNYASLHYTLDPPFREVQYWKFRIGINQINEKYIVEFNNNSTSREIKFL